MALRPLIALVAPFAVLAAACGSSPVETSADASVPLDQVVFDTFDGGSVPLSEASPELIERLLDAIPPIDGPTYETPAAADWLADDDVILGYIDDAGDAWAYPTKILDLHEIVNDELADRPVLVSYCPLCGSGIVFDRRLDGDLLTFSNSSALYESDMVMVDRESGSYWWQVAGTAIVGDRTGAELDLLPSEMARFADWVDRHPETQVLTRPTDRDYERDRFDGYADRLATRGTPFPVTEGVLDDGRLDPGTSVITAEIGGVAWAWPTAPARTVNATIGGRAVEVVTNGVGGAVRIDGDPTPVPSRTLLWFSLVSAEPEIRLGEG